MLTEQISMKTPAGTTLQLDNDLYDDGYLHIEYNKYYAVCDNRPLYHLTRKELLILFCLARAAGRPVAGLEIWIEVWGEVEYKIKTLRVYIANLRRKLAPHGLTVTSTTSAEYCLARTVADR